MNLLEYNNGILGIKWIAKEVQKLNALEELQLLAIGKFSYDWLKLEDLKNQIPKFQNERRL